MKNDTSEFGKVWELIRVISFKPLLSSQENSPLLKSPTGSTGKGLEVRTVYTGPGDYHRKSFLLQVPSLDVFWLRNRTVQPANEIDAF